MTALLPALPPRIGCYVVTCFSQVMLSVPDVLLIGAQHTVRAKDALCRYSTYAAVAGVDPTDDVARDAGLPPIDSINMLPLLLGTNTTRPRNVILLGDTSALSPNADGKTLGTHAFLCTRVALLRL